MVSTSFACDVLLRVPCSSAAALAPSLSCAAATNHTEPTFSHTFGPTSSPPCAYQGPCGDGLPCRHWRTPPTARPTSPDGGPLPPSGGCRAIVIEGTGGDLRSGDTIAPEPGGPRRRPAETERAAGTGCCQQGAAASRSTGLPRRAGGGDPAGAPASGAGRGRATARSGTGGRRRPVGPAPEARW
jgi:hypothetical protein